MKQILFTIASNFKIAENTFEASLYSEMPLYCQSGQFVNILISGCYLRRPISICDATEHRITLVYKTVGKGTETLSQMKAGKTVDVLFPLGKGFETDIKADSPLLIGGGVGIAPLYLLLKELANKKIRVSTILGFNKKEDVFYADKFKELSKDLIITTVDGSFGEKGLVTDVIRKFKYDYFYCCGPKPMMQAVYKVTNCDGEFSLEERMGCGFGACLCCSDKTTSGQKRVCLEGPVFKKEELLW